MKPTYREKNLLDYLFGGFRSTLKREPLRNGAFRKKTCFARRKNRNLALRCGSLFASTQDLSLLHILISQTYSKFTRKNNFLAPGVCFPQPCSSAGRRFAASRSRLQYYRRIVSFPQPKISMKCVVNWIPLRIRDRSSNTQPLIKITQTKIIFVQHK